MVRDQTGGEVGVRGEDRQNQTLFSYVRPDSRIPADHPLRVIRRVTDAALADLSGDFDAMYANEGRPSVPPERLLRALLIQAFCSARSERQLMEQMEYNTGEHQVRLFDVIPAKAGIQRPSRRTAVGPPLSRG